MEYPILIILIALAQYTFFTFKVGFSRGKFEVNAPKTVGNDQWERLFRIQQNTMEQLVIFVPAVLIFAHYVSSMWVLLPGSLFIIGRQIYAHLYAKDPASRSPGVILSLFSNIAMVIGGLIGVGMQLVR